jgi:hypothetical protein
MAVNNAIHLLNSDIPNLKQQFAPYGDVYIVSPDGNATSPVKGFSNLAMFTTIKSAVLSASSGDLIVVLPGIYDEYDLAKNGLSYYFYPNAIVQPTTNSGKVPIFTDNSNSVVKINIYGHGEFLCNGRSNDDTSAFVSGFAGSVYNIEAKTITSLEAWNQIGAVINVKNTTITVEAHSYSGGAISFENCRFENVILLGTYWGNNCSFIAKNCVFIRDAINPVYASAYPGYNQLTRSPFTLVYHLPAFTTPPYSNVVMELTNCDIINTFSTAGGSDCLLVPNYSYTGDSRLSVINCRFYNSDLTKGAIAYKDSSTAPTFTSHPLDDGNNTTAYLANNVGNVGIVNVDADSDGSMLTNQLGATAIYISSGFKFKY